MGKFVYKCVSPHALEASEYKKIIELHQKQLNLSGDAIIEQAKKRDLLYLYYNENQSELIGTVGGQEIHLGNTVVMYYGNTVIEERFRHSHCLPHMIQRSMTNLCMRYPLKKKYHCSLASSAGSYLYFSKFRPSWPTEGNKTPRNILDIMVRVGNVLGGDYRCENGVLISKGLTSYLENSLHKHVHDDSGYFFDINPAFNQGEQIMVLAEFTMEQLSNSTFYSYHDELIKDKQDYNKIKKLRNSHPTKALMLMMYQLYLKRFYYGL